MSADEVAPGVWRSGTRFVNWFLVDAGSDGVTIVDTGLPGYRSQVDGALERIGRTRADVGAVVLTHGHIDHAGAADELGATGVPVHLHPDDAALAVDPRRNRTDRSLTRYLAWPATAAFVAHAVSQGATKWRPMPETVALVDGMALDVPGAPAVTHTPGHTDGSCVLEFREHDVVFVGDLLCTSSPVSGRAVKPQLQTRGSNADSDQAMSSLDRVAAVAARLVLPGHGGPWRDGIQSAITHARRIGCR